MCAVFGLHVGCVNTCAKNVCGAALKTCGWVVTGCVMGWSARSFQGEASVLWFQVLMGCARLSCVPCGWLATGMHVGVCCGDLCGEICWARWAWVSLSLRLD